MFKDKEDLNIKQFNNYRVLQQISQTKIAYNVQNTQNKIFIAKFYPILGMSNQQKYLLITKMNNFKKTMAQYFTVPIETHFIKHGNSQYFVVIENKYELNLVNYLATNLTEQNPLKTMREIARGIQKLHQANFFHGSIKAKNIMFINGQAKINDPTFLIERLEDQSSINQKQKKDVKDLVVLLIQIYFRRRIQFKQSNRQKQIKQLINRINNQQFRNFLTQAYFYDLKMRQFCKKMIYIDLSQPNKQLILMKQNNQQSGNKNFQPVYSLQQKIQKIGNRHLNAKQQIRQVNQKATQNQGNKTTKNQHNNKQQQTNTSPEQSITKVTVEQQIKYLQKQVESQKDEEKLAQAYYNLGLHYFNIKKIKNSEINMLKAVQIGSKISNYKQLPESLYMLAVIHFENMKAEKSRIRFQQFIATQKKEKNYIYWSQMINSYLKLAQIDQYQEYQQNISERYDCLQQILQQQESNIEPSWTIKLYIKMSYYYLQIKEFEKTFNYLQCATARLVKVHQQSDLKSLLLGLLNDYIKNIVEYEEDPKLAKEILDYIKQEIPELINQVDLLNNYLQSAI